MRATVRLSPALQQALALLLLVGAALLPAAAAQEGAPTGAPSDAAILKALCDSIDNWEQYSQANGVQGWEAATPICQWTGVVCTEQGQVRSLSLQCDGCPTPAVGTLPAALGSLSAVTTINLQGNQLFGTLPPEWGAEGVLPLLQNLYLNDNQLTGSIPASWGSPGAFPDLSLLRIDSNRLDGSLPGSWGGDGAVGQGASLPNLLVMRLFNNRIRGSLPEQWGSAGAFPRLQILALNNNSLQGEVPATWMEPTSMQYLAELYLQSNRLSGQLPGTWGKPAAWPNLRFLYLHMNPLGGTLPPEWGAADAFPALKVLGFNDTRLTGTLPPEWGSGGFPSADAFWLERNDLKGTIPASWAGLTSLRRLIVRPGNPALCGPLPPNLPFSICTDADASCVRERPTLDKGQCEGSAAAPGPEAAAPPGGGEVAPPGAVPAPAPAGQATPEVSDGDGSVSAAAIAVPIAVGVPLLLAAAGGFAFLAACKRRRRQHEEEEEEASKEAPEVRVVPAHPFDTEEGRNALTSPFAAGTFQANSHSHSGASEQQQRERQQRVRERERRGPYDSAGTHSSSASSYRSYIAAKCARIETKSIEPGRLPEAEAAAAAAAAAAPAGAGAGALPLGAVGVQLQQRALQQQQGLQQYQHQPVFSSSEEEQQDLVGAMLSQPRDASGGPLGEEEGMGSFVDLPFSDWEISPKEIEIAKRPDGSDWSLGSGGFGKVYKALRHGVQPVAVKVLSTSNDMRQLALADFRREIAILKACRDVNIVQFVGANLGADQTMLVTEYMEGGNLGNNITAGRVSWYRRGKKIALDVARGLVFLHSKRVVHFDLKSPNILLARDGTAKIADVGMAKILARDYVTGVVGTLAWAAPEMLWGERCTEKADIYSFGIVLWEICSGEKPVRGQLRDIKVPVECPAGVRDLILECLETRPSKRPSALELVQRLQALPGEPPAGVTVGGPSSKATQAYVRPPSLAAAAATPKTGMPGSSGGGRGTPHSGSGSRQTSGGGAAGQGASPNTAAGQQQQLWGSRQPSISDPAAATAARQLEQQQQQGGPASFRNHRRSF